MNALKQALLLAGLTMLAASGGCGGDADQARTGADQLQDQNAQLQAQVRLLQDENARLMARLAEFERRSVPDALPTGVLRHVQPTVVGTAPETRIGFVLPEGPALEAARPILRVEDAALPVADLAITRLFWCRQDTERVRKGVARYRDVGLWVPVPSGAIAQVLSAGPGDETTGLLLRPTRRLPDGVYCLHTEVLTDDPALPAFSAPFVIGGFGKPEIAKTEVLVEDGRVVLRVHVRNVGDGAFDDGLLIVTLQKDRGDGRGKFSGRKNVGFSAPIPTQETVVEESVWSTEGWDEGTYYFYGHVNYRYLFDANSLCSFTSDRFAYPRAEDSDR